MKIDGIEIDYKFVAGMAEDLGETLREFAEHAIEERAKRLIEDKVKERMVKLCEELQKRGYDVTETLPRFISFIPVFSAMDVDCEWREENITRAIEKSIRT